MNILFILKHKPTHIGGVERHVERIADRLRRMGKNKINIISDIKYPNIKFLGLLKIWFEIWKRRDLIKNADIIHIHDVFIWYLPFRFIYPNKKVYTTFHGWEGVYPIPWHNIFQKKLSYKLSKGTIVVGNYINKYYRITSNYVIYGGVDRIENINQKVKNFQTIIFLGRLEKDTGLLQFLKWLTLNNQKLKVIFVGDGSLRKKCEKFGRVTGFIKNPQIYLKKAEYCVPAGYLSYLEGLNFGCKIITFSDNLLKQDYWKEIKKINSMPTWGDVVEVYLKLWKI